MTKALANSQQILSHFPNIAYNVVGIAASQGGIPAISALVSALPSNFPAAIVVIQHISPNYLSHLSTILSYRTALQVKQAETGDLLRPGTIYTPVPNRHVLVKRDGTLTLSDAPKVNFTRPAADKLFWSLASSYQMRAITVVLTGSNGDGAMGVVAVKGRGGLVIAQNEATSECFNMPKAAIETGKVDWVLPLEAIAPTLVNLVMSEKVA
ncbi:MAG: chemotaxis protein CheB [Chroococcidiopsidaceae cyanobacterium CP_BM_RX_35]|nr:chemotaxis protein CheB [Chroococcidiopsidaceae cyanobacterium CP_BM_RX_35]